MAVAENGNRLLIDDALAKSGGARSAFEVSHVMTRVWVKRAWAWPLPQLAMPRRARH